MQLTVNRQLQISAQWYSQVLINISDNDKQNFSFFSAAWTVRNRLGILERKPLLGSLDFNVSKITDPKGSVQGSSSTFEKLSNQGQSVQEPSDLAMLGTTNQRIENNREAILGCLTGSPSTLLKTVFTDYPKCVRITVSLEWGRHSASFQTPPSLLHCSPRPGM